MASKSRVKLSRNTGASVNTQAVSPRRNTCGICRKAVVDGKDDALFCEGHCQRWLHRVCASVTEEQHARLAASEQPFLCPACCQAHNLQQIAELTSTVDALKLELEQLKQVVQKQIEKQPQPQRTVPNANMQASSSQGKKSYSSMARKRAKSTPNAVSGNYTAHNAPKPPDNGESSTKEKVPGARRVWGTMKSCTSGTIKGAIARFCNIIDIRVKRKTKQIGENKERWWFVIHGNEESLANLDLLWERVQIQTSWKLETCFKAAASTSHSTLQSFPTPLDSQATAPAPTVPSPIVPVPTAENVDETGCIVPKSTVNNVVNETQYTAVSDSALEEHHTSQSESFLSVTQTAQLNT